MIYDSLLCLTGETGQAVPLNGTSALVSTNVFDLSMARDIGQGQPLYAVFTALTNIVIAQTDSESVAVNADNVGLRFSIHAVNTATPSGSYGGYPVIGMSSVFQSAFAFDAVVTKNLAYLYQGTQIAVAINPLAFGSTSSAIPARNGSRLIYSVDGANTISMNTKGAQYGVAVVDAIDVVAGWRNYAVWIQGSYRIDLSLGVSDPVEFHATRMTQV